MALLLSTGGLSYALTAAGTDDDTTGDPSDPIVLTAGEDADEQETEEPDGDDEGKPEKSPKVKKARSTEGCPEGFEGNHGQFVSSSEDKQAAAHSDCGKPVKPDKKEKPEKSPKVEAEKPEKTPKAEKTPKPDKTPKPEKTAKA
jgi:hypothetical protein